ncbi:MAG: CDP-alcohol phosphatidyltransferase family protein [Polyangiaceae bacterium]|nr:CDP-alcohol phosphatidyltransferase family protein [Polyangiaceae bacterium]
MPTSPDTSDRTNPTNPAQDGDIDEGSSAFIRDLGSLPNIVSLARVVLIYIGIGLWYYGHFALGLGIGVLAGLSDYLDGYLARKLNQSTRIGGLIDQAADVLFMMGVIYIFVRDGTWPAILLYTVMFREVVVMNLRASAAEMGFSLPSIFLGKFASNWMFYALAIMAAHRGHLLPEPLNTYIGYLAHFGMTGGITMSVITAVIYFRKYMAQYKSLPRKRAAGADKGA